MRLINVDKLIKPIYAEDDNITGSGMSYDEMDGYNDAIDMMWNYIQRAPTVDAVPVVRCKDCKYAYYYNEEGCRGFVCNGYFQYADVESNDFCSYGKMRNNYE